MTIVFEQNSRSLVTYQPGRESSRTSTYPPKPTCAPLHTRGIIATTTITSGMLTLRELLRCTQMNQ
jgi:hypothetical protein